ncbi:MAG: hypothetical protein JWO58_1405 [Chitinophagaceae bacterium]|nr:hypothetical protein [Chitinophagaceae bacterium]
MPNKYPEDIDQLDDFYKSQLADFEITPPDHLWDKISAGQAAGTSASVAGNNASSSFLSGTTKIIGLSVVTCGLIAAGLYYFIFRSASPSPNDHTEAPAIEQSVEKTNESGNTHTTPANSNPTEATHPSSSVHPGNPQQNAQNGQSNPAQETSTEGTPVLINTPKEELKTDSIAEIKPVEKPKEKVKFKDKYKKEYQDSTSKLFVPGSK